MWQFFPEPVTFIIINVSQIYAASRVFKQHRVIDQFYA